jgi:hypothetical protein
MESELDHSGSVRKNIECAHQCELLCVEGCLSIVNANARAVRLFLYTVLAAVRQ